MNGIHEVGGSIPPGSTKSPHCRLLMSYRICPKRSQATAGALDDNVCLLINDLLRGRLDCVVVDAVEAALARGRLGKTRDSLRECRFDMRRVLKRPSNKASPFQEAKKHCRRLTNVEGHVIHDVLA